MSVDPYQDGTEKSDGIGANKKRDRVKWILIFGMLITVMGGAFTAGRLFRSELPSSQTQNLETMKSVDGSLSTYGVRLQPDERLPDELPTAAGQFNHRKDNLLFIHQFPASGMVMLDKMDEYPLLEILITKDTLIYKDVTDLSDAKNGGEVQQKIVSSSLEELTKGSSILVWGEQRGERIIAEVVQYF